MPNDEAQEIGKIVWVDLTIPDAEKVREFYLSVTGWEANTFKMGDYNDYVVQTPQNRQTVAGLCHARGANADQPPQWIIYIKVRSLEESLDAAKRLGGGHPRRSETVWWRPFLRAQRSGRRSVRRH